MDFVFPFGLSFFHLFPENIKRVAQNLGDIDSRPLNLDAILFNSDNKHVKQQSTPTITSALSFGLETKYCR